MKLHDRPAKRMSGALLDLIYPRDLYCISCGKIIDATRTYRMCDDCMDNMRWVGERTCKMCGKKLNDNNPGDICFGCRQSSHVFDRGYTCTEYGNCERAAIFALKYDGRADIGDTLGEIMYDRMRAFYTDEELRDMFDLVIPVPVHPRKKAVRGYNQAALIARSFSERAGIPCDDGIMYRAKETRMMRSLKPHERRENITGAFAIRSWRLPDVSCRSVLVVDDIYTTGATADEMASVLLAGGECSNGAYVDGADSVSVLTYAAGADMILGS